MPPSTTVNQEAISSLSIHQEVAIVAPIEIAWEAVLDQMGPKSEMPDGKPFPLVLEAWPGGRLFRDLGNSTGHLWGHVQVIKPPKLLEPNPPVDPPKLERPPNPPVEPLAIIQLVQKNKHIKLAGNDKLRIEKSLVDVKERAQMVRDVLRSLGQPKIAEPA